MVQKLRSILLFYKRFLFFSLAVNFLLLFLNFELPVSATLKILLFGLILFTYLTTKQKNKLTFYHNLSIRTYYLFGISLFLDLTLLILTYLIFANVT